MLTGHYDVLVVLNHVLDNSLGVLNNIYIPPQNPSVFRLQCGGQQEVTCLAHSHSPRTLELKGMPDLDILALPDPKIFSNHRNTVERTPELGIGLVLDTIHLESQ